MASLDPALALKLGRLVGELLASCIHNSISALLLGLCVYWVFPGISLAFWQWFVTVYTIRLIIGQRSNDD